MTWSDDDFADLVVEQLADIGPVGQIASRVDGEDDVARLEIEAALVGRAALEDLGDLQARARDSCRSKIRPRSAVSSSGCAEAAARCPGAMHSVRRASG